MALSRHVDSDFFNRKIQDPSRLMSASDGRRYRCSWIEQGFTVHSDGNVTCGLDDPHGRRSFGNVSQQSVVEIWSNPEYNVLREKLWNGHRCTECSLSFRVPDSDSDVMPARYSLPTTLVIETTVRCNIRCPQNACIPNNDPSIRTRDIDFLSMDSFRKAVDQLADHLSVVCFFNYGDPFVHAKASDMLGYLRKASPTAYVKTSTNGIPLSKFERASQVVESGGLDHITFTISGVTQETYSRYHVGGQLDLAMRGMTNVIQAKKRLGLQKPIVHWRYLLFNWNDSVSEIDYAISLSESLGVDEFSIHLTQEPLGAASFRFSPGSQNFSRYRRYISCGFNYTLIFQRPDENGFYEVEQTGLGAARWTGWQARKRLRVVDNLATLAVSTSRVDANGGASHVLIVTPWQRLKALLQPNTWRSIEIHVPIVLQLEEVEIEIVTFDHWSPAEEHGSGDTRCLGVLVKESEQYDGVPPCDLVVLDDTDVLRLAEFRFRAPEPLLE